MNRYRNHKNLPPLPLVPILKWSLILFIGLYGAYLFLKFMVAMVFIAVLKTF